MAAGARTSAAAPLSGRSGAAADATMRRGARLLVGFRRRVTLRPARGIFILRPRWSRRFDTLSQASSPPLGSDGGPGCLDWRIFCGVVLLGNCARGKWTTKLVCIDILAFSLFCIRTFVDSSTGVWHLRQAFPLCSRYVRLALALWLDTWVWFCCGNFHQQ